MENRGAPLSAPLIDNKENINPEYLKVKKNMKTTPQYVNKVCPPLAVNPKTDKSTLDAGKASTRPFLSTKSPITGRPVKPAKRTGLSTLQRSSSNKSGIVGTARSRGLAQKELKQTKFEIFCEETERTTLGASKTPKAAFASASTQTNFDEWLSLAETKKPDELAEEALHLLRSEPSNEEYYKDIAEQRRLALEEALLENEDLHDELKKLKQKCTDLESELSEAESYKLLYLAMI